ncbi:hypothetical protein HK102_000637 [Quaeritorhiza haematococci]|nr:hypothetical protein HK102_000637 [Quaeritorhiza haematococci]
MGHIARFICNVLSFTNLYNATTCTESIPWATLPFVVLCTTAIILIVERVLVHRRDGINIAALTSSRGWSESWGALRGYRSVSSSVGKRDGGEAEQDSVEVQVEGEKVPHMDKTNEGATQGCGEKGKGILYVCVDCNMRFSCNGAEGDIEDLGGMTTGTRLYKRVKAAIEERKTSQKRCHQQETCDSKMDLDKASSSTPATGLDGIKLVPIGCLELCDNGNSIAFTHPNKYGYQFGDLHHSSASTVQDIVEFAAWYGSDESGDAYTKPVNRPGALKKGISARIPPVREGVKCEVGRGEVVDGDLVRKGRRPRIVL